MASDNDWERLKELLIRAENNIQMVKEVKLPITIKRKIARAREIELDPKKTIEVVSGLFYEKGRPISVKEIIERFDIKKADKFGDRVIKRPLKDAIKWVKLGGKRAPDYFYPSAVIMKFEGGILDPESFPSFYKTKFEGGILDPESFPSFYKTLREFSKAVEVNLCRHKRSLYEFLSFIGKNEDTAMRKLIGIAKEHHVGKDYCAGSSHCQLVKDVWKETFEEEFAKGIPYTRIGDLFLEFHAWFGNGEEEFRYGDIICEYNERETLQLPEELQPIVERIIERKKVEAKDKKQTYDDNPLYRLVGVQLERPVIDEIGRRRQKLRLFLGPTSFFLYSATNLMLKEITVKNEHGNSISLWKKSVEGKNLNNASYLRDSNLPNPLGIALAVLTNDNPPKIVLHKRSRAVFMGPDKYSLPAEKMIRGVDIDMDKIPPEPSPFITAKRCIKDELYVEVEKTAVKFLVLGIRLDYLQPQLLGVVRLKISGEELLKVKDMAIDKWEASGIQLVEFSLNEELKSILMLEEKRMSSTAKLTIIYALINEYGYKNVDSWLTLFK